MPTTGAARPPEAARVRRSLLAAVPSAALFVAVAAIWGLNTVAMRVAGRNVPPLTVAAARSLVGALVLLGIARASGADRPRGRAEWFGIVAIAIPMTSFGTAFLFLSARNIPAGLLSILSNTMPIFVAVLAAVFLRERTTVRGALGIAIGLGGTVLVAWRAIEGEVRLIGVVYALLAALTSGFGSVMYRRFPLPRLDRTMVVSVQLLLSSVLLALVAIPDDRSRMRFPWTFWLSFAYLATVGLALSFVMFAELSRRLESTRVSAVSYVSTVLGVAFGALLLHERLSWLTLLGGVIAIGGVAVVQTAKPGGRAARA
jgi:drug/metabolite transporter (DMT)-like permease